MSTVQVVSGGSVAGADPGVRRKMVRQKTMCALARPIGIGVLLSQLFLIGFGISNGWWSWLFALCGLALAVVGHIGMVEWKGYAKARFEMIESNAKSRGPDGSEILYLTEDELVEVSELVGHGWRSDG